MKVVYGLEVIAEMVEENNRIEKAEREIRKQRIKELMSEGISKEIAIAMTDAFISCGL